MIGPGVVGHWVAPGERDVPDPDEYLKVDARSVRPRNGLLSFRFMEPMEETVYLDQVRLLAIDHPAAYEVYPERTLRQRTAVSRISRHRQPRRRIRRSAHGTTTATMCCR